MQDILTSQMLKFLHDQRISLTDKRMLLAVSGGVDSMVMMHLFQQSGLEAGVAHCNFGLRGTDSDDDEAFVMDMARKMNMPCHTIRFDTSAYAKDKGISTQMAARALRYEWFENLLYKENYDFLAVAHHTDDNLETVLLNLTRGTGLAGVRGILPMKGKLIRPLLFTDRSSVMHYAEQQQISWREDSSNSSDYYYRNQIRHHVLPVLKKINPSLGQTFRATAERLVAADNLVKQLFQKWHQEAVSEQNGHILIDIALLSETPEPALFLSDTLQPYGFSYSQVKEILHSLEGISGKVFYAADYCLVKDRSSLILQKNKVNIRETVITEMTETFAFGKDRFKIESLPGDSKLIFRPDIAFLDASKLIFPLIMRSWQTGDRFFPLGMKGKSKKISDLFTDLKVAVTDKSQTGILVNGNGEIIWAAGLRLDERYAVSKHTKHIIAVSLFPKATSALR